MKYSIGYQLHDEFDSVLQICRDYNESISNVYFSWADEHSGRLPLCTGKGSKEVEHIQLAELKEIKKLGKSLTLLLNANCYGESAVSKEFRDRILSLCKYLKNEIDIDKVTTTSPFAADVISDYFKGEIKVIASVNMRIGTVKAMQQLLSYFDGFYIAKECNRDLKKLKELKDWCDKNKKKLCILANSGCMPHCGFQTFHDNLVAHQSIEQEIDFSWDAMPAPCHKYLRSMQITDGLAYFLQGTWIRPEDTIHYTDFCDEMKLATRMHDRMRMVVAAYVRGYYRGNLLDLTEPSYSHDFKGTVLDNTCIPKDFFKHILKCNKDCSVCLYCKAVAEKAAIRMQ